MQFYIKILEAEDIEGNKLFNTFGNFAMQILALPTSNADAERLFSKLTLIKSKVRNSLQLPSIKSLIQLSETVTNGGGCNNFTPTQAMLECL